MKLLMHTCCGPCAAYPVGHFRAAGWDVVGFWYNPNVHPWTEHERRRESMALLAGALGLPMHWSPGYEMPAYLSKVAGRPGKPARCIACYRMRLERTAGVAAETGMDAFTTSLLISPYQDHEALRAAGEEAAAAAGVPFVYADLRRYWPERGRLMRLHSLYRQQYCGCLYSEWERFRDAPAAPARAGAPAR